MKFLRTLFKKKYPDVLRRNKEPDVYKVSSEEELMNAAIEKAQLTVNYFKSSLVSPLPNQQYFSVKAKIEDGDIVEHIWLNDVSFDDSSNFFGTIGNEPVSLQNVKEGHQVGVPMNKLSDWMIVENGRLIGGYTIRALREKMTKKERKSFDESIGMLIDEGADYFSHDFSTPEGAILCLEDAYDAKDIEQAMNCKDFHEEAKLMLAKFPKMESSENKEEMLNGVEEVIRLSFIKHLQDGFPSFQNTTRAFPKKEYISDNLVIVTEICFSSDHTKTTQRLYVSRKGDDWKVLSLAD